MNFKTLPGIAALVASTVLPIALLLGYEAYRTRNLTAEIIVRAPEKGNYFPRELSIPVGKKASLRLRNVDTVTHGFAIPALGVDAGEIKAGSVALVEFTPQEMGSFEFYCTVWCSDYHLDMRGKLNVVAEQP